MPPVESQLPPLPEDSDDESGHEDGGEDDAYSDSDSNDGTSGDDDNPKSRPGRSAQRERKPSDKHRENLQQEEIQANQQLAVLKKQLEKAKKKALSLQRQNDKLQGNKAFESEDETVGAQKAKELRQLFASSTSTRPAVQAHGQGQVAPRGEFIKVIMKPKKPKLVTTTRKSMYSIPDNGSDDDHDGGSKDGGEDAAGYQPDFATEDNTMHEEDPLTTRDRTPSTRLAPGLPTPMPTQSRAPLMDTAVVPMAQMTPAQVSAERHVAASRKRQSGAEPVGGVQPMPKRQHLGSSSKEQDQPNDRSSPEALEVTHTSKKPKAGDYAEDVAPVLIRASQEYEARIYSKGAFPESLAQIRHANLCLRHASRTLGIKTKFTTSIGRVIKVRGSTIRGRSITIVRKLVETQYGFALPERPLTSNIKLSAYLLEDNRYMHKNIENTDQYLAEHPIVPRVLQEVIFPQSKGAAAMGVVYEKYFNPISLDTLALIFSQVRHCILEWSSGKLVPKDYTEKIAMQGEAFTTLVQDLQDWEDADPDLTKKLRAKMFKKAKNLSNVQGQSTTSVPRLTAERKRRIAAHLATRTGDTDSEVEDQDEAGRGAGDENVGAAGASRG